MPYRSAHARLSLRLLLLLGCLPLACATGVQQEFAEDDQPTSGSSNGGSLSVAGGESGGSGNHAGSSSGGSGGSTSNPFGGTSSTAGKAGSDGGGSSGSSSGGDGGSAGASGGSGGSSAGSGGSGGGSGGSGGSGDVCGCSKTLTWTDNTVMNWGTGDCVTTADTTYVYVGTKAQTYANGQCNPAKQEAWCTDMGNDYKFMVCP